MGKWLTELWSTNIMEHSSAMERVRLQTHTAHTDLKGTGPLPNSHTLQDSKDNKSLIR